MDPQIIQFVEYGVLFLLALSNVDLRKKVTILKKIANPATSRQDKQKMLKRL